MDAINSTLESSRTLYGVVVLLLWTLTSFFCHFCGKSFLAGVATMGVEGKASSIGPWLGKSCHAVVLTFTQLVFCYALVKLKNESDSPTHSKVAKVGHALATLATNFSMAMMFASSTFAIKLMEPITSAIIQYLMIGTPLTPVTIFSLPVIVGGAIAFAGNPLEYSSTSLGALAALISNLVLAFRNIAIKQMSSKESSPMNLELNWRRLKWFITVGLLLFICVLYLENMHLLPDNSTYVIIMGCTSAFFHVSYSFVSTGMVLTKISVVSHAVANILKRVLVVLLLYSFGRRVASVSNFMGLAACTIGLLVYVWDKTRHNQTAVDKDHRDKPSLFRYLSSWKLLPLGIACMCLLLMLSMNTTVNEKKAGDVHQNTFFQNIVNEHRRLFSNDLNPQVDATSDRLETYGDDAKSDRLETHGDDAKSDRLETHGDDATSDRLETNGDDAKSDRGQLFSRNTFNANGHTRPTDEELQPLLDEFSENTKTDIEAFLQRRLITEPGNANFLSEKLTRTSEITREAQRIHFNILEDVLKKFKYAMLFDIASFENKGDPCITIGEIYFLERMNIKLLYYCNFYGCTKKNMGKARIIADDYSPDELVILVHGGGNIIGYASNDYIRFKLFNFFPEFQKMVFPQSIWMKNRKHAHVNLTITHYCCNENLTLVLRDQQSYNIAKDLYKGSTQLLMAPDMAFQIARVERFISPVFDIMWIKRSDGESPGYSPVKNVPDNIRVHISDWWKWKTPKAGNSLEKAFYIAANGFFFLQRGRVIITDRLHGHILATLMDIPHVLIDNKAKKLSAYHNTWTRSVENTIITDDPAKALDLALGLLKKYNDSLPAIVPFMDIDENFKPVPHGVPILGYP